MSNQKDMQINNKKFSNPLVPTKPPLLPPPSSSYSSVSKMHDFRKNSSAMKREAPELRATQV